MNRSNLRLAVVVLVVLAGAVILWQGFPSVTSAPATTGGGGGGTAATSPSPTSSPKPPASSPTPAKPKDQIQGTSIQVYNTTTQTGIAGTVQGKLEKQGAVTPAPPENASPALAQTTIYYVKPADRSVAMVIEKKYLPGAKVDVLPSDTTSLPQSTKDIDPSTQVVIYLGNDYPL